jgi:hypothetical protein
MGNKFGKFEEFKDIVERRVSETKEAKKRGVKDYLEISEDYNAEEIPHVKENCLKEHCNPICSHGLCTPHIPSIEGLIAYFEIGRFIYIDEKGNGLNVQSKLEQKCSEITHEILEQIKLIDAQKPTSFKRVDQGDISEGEEITYQITDDMKDSPQKIFNECYRREKNPWKWAFIYNRHKYVLDDEVVISKDDLQFKQKKVKKVKKQKSVKKSKKIVKSIKVKSRTPKKTRSKKLTRRTPKKSH